MDSITVDDYIRTVYLLEQRNNETKSKDIASYLKVKKSSVSEMISKLKSAGMLNYKKYSKVSLTKKGRKLAEKLTFRHRVIEAFLTKMLKRSVKEVHEEAHKLEHAFSGQSIQSIYNILGRPRIGVHGEEIKKPEVC